MQFDYNVLFEKGDYALVETGREYKHFAVVRGLVPKEKRFYKGDDWAYTVTYASNDIEGLTKMLDVFRSKTEENYISKERLIELATLFKDGLIEDDKENAMEYFEDTCAMEDYEKKFFGIGEEDDEE